MKNVSMKKIKVWKSPFGKRKLLKREYIKNSDYHGTSLFIIQLYYIMVSYNKILRFIYEAHSAKLYKHFFFVEIWLKKISLLCYSIIIETFIYNYKISYNFIL